MFIEAKSSRTLLRKINVYTLASICVFFQSDIEISHRNHDILINERQMKYTVSFLYFSFSYFKNKPEAKILTGG